MRGGNVKKLGRGAEAPTNNEKSFDVPPHIKGFSCFWTMSRNTKIKLPQHFVALMCKEGHSKHIALFSSLKKLYSSGHIHNYKGVNLTKLFISRKTYYKYLRELELLYLIKNDGKGGFHLIGQDALLRIYPTTQNLHYIYLENNKELRGRLEEVATEYNLISQRGLIHKAISNNVEAQNHKIIKTVCGKQNTCVTPLEYEISLSCKKQARLLGYKSAMTGLRRRRKYEDSNFIKTIKRKIYLGKLSRELLEEYQRLKWVLFKNKFGNWYRVIANEIIILRGNIGKKVVEIIQGEKTTFCDNPLFNEYW